MAVHDPQMLKGVVGLLLLRLIGEQEDYGYGLLVRLQRTGFAELSEGTVYPALTRLEAAGHLQARLARSASGPARKYLSLTPTGEAELQRARGAWLALVDAVSTVVPRKEAR
jgi:PadR family transcriptional regulator PadR